MRVDPKQNIRARTDVVSQTRCIRQCRSDSSHCVRLPDRHESRVGDIAVPVSGGAAVAHGRLSIVLIHRGPLGDLSGFFLHRTALFAVYEQPTQRARFGVVRVYVAGDHETGVPGS